MMRLLIIWLIISCFNVNFSDAKALLAVFESYVVEAKTYPVEWLSDSEDYLKLLLVRQNDNGWSQVLPLFENLTSDAPGGTYQWTVPTNLTPGGGYGLWLRSVPTNPNGTLGYADLTEWFDIRFANGSLPTSTVISSLAATTSATGSTFTLDRPATATAQSADTGSAASQNDDLSRHAIVGIAIGCSVGVTIILILSAILIIRCRKIREDVSKYPPPAPEHHLVRPSFTTMRSLVELPEDPMSGRIEILAQTKYPLEMEADNVTEQKKTVLPEKPVEIG